MTNITHYKIVIDKLYADDQKLDGTILSLVDLLGKTGDKWDNALPISLSKGSFSFKKDSDEEISELRSLLGASDDADAARCFELLCDRYSVGGDYSDEQKLTLAAVRYGMELAGYSNSKPYTFASDVSRDAVSAVSENTQGVGGVDVQTYLVRSATNPTLAPHVLGALGAVTQEEYEELAFSGKQYGINDEVGKFGI